MKVKFKPESAGGGDLAVKALTPSFKYLSRWRSRSSGVRHVFASEERKQVH